MRFLKSKNRKKSQKLTDSVKNLQKIPLNEVTKEGFKKMIHAYDDSTKEKAGIITLTKTVSMPGNEVGSCIWSSSDLTAAGIDANNLGDYAVLDYSKSFDNEYWRIDGGQVLSSAGQNTIYPHAIIDTVSGSITIYDYINESQAYNITYKVRLIKAV